MRRIFHTKAWLIERLEPNGDCLEWTGSKTRYGYGLYHTMGKTKQVHRLAWELHVGAIPDRLCVLHRCDNPSCCNPDHLFLGTQQDNIGDMMKKGRQRGARSARHPKAKLTEEIVRELRRRSPSESYAGLAREFGVTRTAVRFAVTRKTWAYIK